MKHGSFIDDLPIKQNIFNSYFKLPDVFQGIEI